jgi:hypothetical protein
MRELMVPAEGIGIFSGVENTQLIDFSRPPKTLKTAKLP